jgi:hypothetical protein
LKDEPSAPAQLDKIDIAKHDGVTMKDISSGIHKLNPPILIEKIDEGSPSVYQLQNQTSSDNLRLLITENYELVEVPDF